ncbi:hypothetical protein NLJ89_g5884 [Agrocybe chaxingu]|uniref:Uncharacterized protein n=1 Tax=Agrocybe chaxingu TaxID=84603 RepID=A0A9W8MWJ3_9AGAR|nr:hypothetical protein NLJ89_g5884 [Agrocybe chaxingu]
MLSPAFDLLVVGAGGGPDETNLSAYLVKLHNADWEEGVVALEAGSGQGRKDDLLFGHLTPEHLGNELATLASEVVKHRLAVQQNESRRRPLRKKLKRGSLTAEELKDALLGVCIYIIHCKDDMNGDLSKPIREVIVDQVKKVVDEKGLGAMVLAAEQGMRIEI